MHLVVPCFKLRDVASRGFSILEARMYFHWCLTPVHSIPSIAFHFLEIFISLGRAHDFLEKKKTKFETRCIGVKIEDTRKIHISSFFPARKPQNVHGAIFKPRKVEIRRRGERSHETRNDSVISLRPERERRESERENFSYKSPARSIPEIRRFPIAFPRGKPIHENLRKKRTSV